MMINPATAVAIGAASALSLGSLNLFAQCDNTTDPVSGSTIENSLVCAFRPGQSANPSQRWSEIHNGTGGGASTLGEHGRGSTDPAGSYDPNIGTWSYNGADITYNYDGAGTYTWTLKGSDSSTPQYFCDNTTLIAEIKAIVAIPASNADNPCTW